MSNGGRIPAAAESTHDLRARVEDLEPVGPRLEPELGAEVDRAEEERDDAGRRRRLVGRPEAGGRLDDRDHRRPVRAERGDRLGRRLRQHDRVGRELLDERQIVGEPLCAGAVDPDDRRTQLRHELARRRLLRRRDRVLEIGDDGVGARCERRP